MNRNQVAAARAKMHEALDELFDALEGDDAATDPPSPTERKRKRAVRSFPRPLSPVSETDRMRARQMLRRRGIST